MELTAKSYIQMAKVLVGTIVKTSPSPEQVNMVFTTEKMQMAWIGYLLGKGYSMIEIQLFEESDQCEDNIEFIRANW